MTRHWFWSIRRAGALRADSSPCGGHGETPASFARQFRRLLGAPCSGWCQRQHAVFYVFWELTSGAVVYARRPLRRTRHQSPRRQALVVTTLGGLAMLVGIVVLSQYSGAYLLSELVARAARKDGLGGTAVNVGSVLV